MPGENENNLQNQNQGGSTVPENTPQQQIDLTQAQQAQIILLTN